MKNQLLFKRILIIVGLIAIGILTYIYFSVLLPILLALLTAMIFEPLVRLLQRHLKVQKRILPVTIVFISFIVMCGAILYFTLTKVIESLYEWALELPYYATQIQQFADQLIRDFNDAIEGMPQANLIVQELERQSDGLIDTAWNLTTQILTSTGNFLQSIPNLLFITLVFLITLFLISLDLPRLLNLFFNMFNKGTSEKLRFVFHKMGKVFLGYWKAQFILSVGVLVVTYISLLFIAPEAAGIMSFIIWTVDIIPLYVGPALILVPWGIVAMIIGNVNTGIQLIVLAVVLLILRRAIEPKVLGDSIGLAALPTVLSMYFGFVFFGVLGLIFGPFVYIAIRSAKESGLFDLKLMGKEDQVKK